MEPTDDTGAAATLFNLEVQKEWRKMPSGSNDIMGGNKAGTVALFRRAVQHDGQASLHACFIPM
jgi:hypothetical protein